ncbi:hypothetical protein [Methanosarcina horonobensis]|uniref:hypothetical protein n=1 Tax=Methanosarcina horonobensis TaxID=418008 RepID=UPI000A55488B|nr:hypothetical protein [Methanosarcina horonobensis]
MTAPTNKFAGIYGISTNAILPWSNYLFVSRFHRFKSIVSSFTFETTSKNPIPGVSE